MANADQIFNFDKYFDNFLKNDPNSTEAEIKNDIKKVYSQYPFSNNDGNDFFSEKYQKIKEQIKNKLKEKYQKSNSCPDQTVFSNDVIDACVGELGKDFCSELKKIHEKK